MCLSRDQKQGPHTGHTSVERCRELKSADELRVETRGNLNAHAAAEEPDIHDAEVLLVPPSHRILLHHAGDEGVAAMALLRL